MIYDQIVSAGLDGSLAIDLASVLWNTRPVGLAHVPINQLTVFSTLLESFGIQSLTSRALSKNFDALTGQYILSAACKALPENLISEVWFSKKRLETRDLEKFVISTGEILGYPDCCIKAYEDSSNFKGLYNRYIRPGSERNWQLNRLASQFGANRLTLDYLPCSLSCGCSLRIAQEFDALFLRDVLGPKEYARRVTENRMLYGLIKGTLFRFWNADEGASFTLGISDLEKSSFTFDIDLGDREIGIFAFDHNIEKLNSLQFLKIQSHKKLHVFPVKIL